MRKNEAMAMERMREWEEKKKQWRELEKKRNPEEREGIDKISIWYNILIQEIQLLMYRAH